jgi:hypothetical protein
MYLYRAHSVLCIVMIAVSLLAMICSQYKASMTLFGITLLVWMIRFILPWLIVAREYHRQQKILDDSPTQGFHIHIPEPDFPRTQEEVNYLLKSAWTQVVALEESVKILDQKGQHEELLRYSKKLKRARKRFMELRWAIHHKGFLLARKNSTYAQLPISQDYEDYMHQKLHKHLPE